MTNTALKTQIDTDITNKTTTKSISPLNVGKNIKDVVDYTVQETATKESLENKSVNIITDATSDVKYPSVKAVKTYVDSTITENASTEDIYCVVRYPIGSTTWELINDASHEPSVNISGIITNPTTEYNFSIQHNNGYTKIGSMLAGIDETYANFGLQIGASVGLTNSLFRITKTGFTIRALVSGGVFLFANDLGQIVKETDFSYTFDTGTGNMVVSHPNIVCTYGDSVILTPYGTTFTVRLVSKTSTSSTFQWYNNGVLVTALSTSMKLYLTRTGVFQCTNEQIANSSSNFWIRGVMKK